jgi:hypothetical protein
MKQLFILVIMCFSFQTLSAQDKIDQLAEKTCECLKTKNFKNKTKEEIEMELGFCMISEAQKLHIDMNLKDESSMEKFGEKVGLRMATICPESFIKYLSQETKDGSTLMSDYLKEDKTAASIQKITGTITKFTKDDLAYLFIKTTEGREVKLIVLEYFTNADKLIESSKDFINKKATIEFKEVEYYLPRIGEFVKMKEITSLSIE